MKYIGKCTPAWTMLERNFQKTVEEKNNILFQKNGPGLYKVSDTEKYKYRDGPKWSIRPKIQYQDEPKNDDDFSNCSQEQDESDQRYQLFSQTRKSKSQTTFGCSKRFQQNVKQKQAPGPDTYNLNSCFKTVKKLNCNISSRNYSVDNKNKFGPPIQYDIKNTNWVNGRKVYFKVYKNQIKKSKSQGKHSMIKQLPKQFQQKKTKRCNSTFGVGKRMKNQDKYQAPINYDLQKIAQYYKKDKHFSFGIKPKQKDTYINGPKSEFYIYKNYDIKKGIGCSFGTSQRFTENKENTDRNVLDTAIKNIKKSKISQQKGYIFGSDSRLQIKKNLNPGPGSYAIPSQFDKVKKEQKISYPVLSLKQNEDMPGPGQYNPSIKYRDRKGRLIFGEKFKQKFKKTCDKFYDTQGKIGNKGCQFAKSSRFKRKNQDLVIGPEFYDLKSTIPQIQPWMNCYVDDQLNLRHKNIRLINTQIKLLFIFQ